MGGLWLWISFIPLILGALMAAGMALYWYLYE